MSAPSALSSPAANIVRRGEPSRTAHRVATLRAVHQLLDEPVVLRDPVALPLLGPAAEAALRRDPFALNDPLLRGLRAALVARSRFVEDELARGRATGAPRYGQYVVLGAGLDTFAYRRPAEAAPLQVFEVDHAATQRWKQSLLAQAGIDPSRWPAFVALDFEHDDLWAALAAAGFRPDEPACVGWMGVTPYLTAEAVERVLRTLARLAPGSCLCFDFRVPATMLDPVSRAIDAFIGAQAAEAGEPWLSAFDPAALCRQLLDAGFSAADCTTPDELNARYFDRRKDGLRTGGSLRLMCARTGAAR